MTDSPRTTRRGFVRAAAGTAAVAGTADAVAAQEGTDTGGATATAGGEDGTDGGGEAGTDGGGGGGGGEPEFDGWFDDVGNYDGEVADLTGQDSAEVEVGAEGNGGAFAFAPPAIHVDNGATVTWIWTGQGGGHNVVEEEEVFDSGEPISDEGTTFEYTFEEDGIYRYICEPHLSLGMKGAVVVGTDYPSAGGGGDGGGGGAARPSVPDAAKSLGIATAFAMAATLGLSYFFIKYGGDYGGFEES